MQIDDLYTLEDVTELTWADVVVAAPPDDLPVYLLPNVLEARRFVSANGLEFIATCRLYIGDGVLAVEPVGAIAEIADHAIKLLSDL